MSLFNIFYVYRGEHLQATFWALSVNDAKAILENKLLAMDIERYQYRVTCVEHA